MVELHFKTAIRAPIAECFRLSLSLDIEAEAMKQFGLRAVGGRTSGVIGAGERVVWEVRQFGVQIRHTTEITGYAAPDFFEDSMVSGVFRTFCHDHYFRDAGGGVTEVLDEVRFGMPWYLGGVMVEWLLVGRRMRRLIEMRNRRIREVAEGLA